MERWIKRTIELATGLAFVGKSDPAVIPYYPQKTEISGEEKRHFPRTSPEAKGVSSGRLLSMLRALEKDKAVNLHALMCIKGGEVICECAHPGYGTNTWHLSHSMSKTVTGMAIGMLVDDGALTLDTRLTDIFPDVEYADEKFALITVRHLLTMTSGVRFAEAGSVTEERWTECFFGSSLAFVPGEEFAYNSMNSYILAVIVTRLTGKSLSAFLDDRLFGPLGITNRFWEKSPEGVEKGGWGLYLSAESWAKLGYMMLRGGVFEGKRILSGEWVRESHQRHARTPERIGHFDYGYQLWSSRDDGGYLFNGMLGQNVWIYPDNDLVVVMLSGSNDMFQNSRTRAIVEEYLATDLSGDLTSAYDGDTAELRYIEEHFFERRHQIRPYVPKMGLAHRLGLKSAQPYPKEWDELLGEYRFGDNAVGIMPLIIRTMQNNFSAPLKSIAFQRDGDAVFFVYREGEEEYRLEIGFSTFKETVIDYHGEKYIARVMGEALEDEDREALYKLEILFPELPNTRLMKFSFREDGALLVRLYEMPSEKIADTFLKELEGTNPKMSSYMHVIEKRLGKNVANKRLVDTFSPRLIGARVGSPEYVSVMDKEREKRRGKERSARLIDALVDKLLREEDDSAERGFIGEIVDKIKLKMTKKQRKSDANGDAGEEE